jgi:hypothetical protein
MATDIGTASASIGLANGQAQWQHDMADYLEKKRNLQFEMPAYKKVTHGHVKQQDVLYNPVT